MLDKVTAKDFKGSENKTCQVVIDDGPDATLTIIDVTELERFKAPGSKRTPFTVTLRSDDRCMMCEGRPRNIELPNGTYLEGVMINEIGGHPKAGSPHDDTLTPNSRFYQICFN